MARNRAEAQLEDAERRRKQMEDQRAELVSDRQRLAEKVEALRGRC